MRTRTIHRLVPALGVFAGALLLSSVAHAANYKLCVDIEVQNTDSGTTGPTGITEDHYLTATPTVVPARGFYVRVVTGNHTLFAGYADSSTGCVEFTESGSNYVVDVQVRSLARHGTTYLRAHNGGSTTNTSSPGSHFTWNFLGVLLPPSSTRRVEIPLNLTWNAFATGSFALSRVATGLQGKTIQMGFADAGSTSIHSGATSYIASGTHLIRINNARRQRMFEVVHEIGHAAARLNFGQNGAEDTFGSGFAYSGTTDFDCTNVDGYSIRSVEYNSLGFKEGFANLYAARVFNDRADDGSLRMHNRTLSLERFQAASLGNPQGGHLRNHCYAGVLPPNGVSTIEDWTRFLWDVYTSETCGSMLGLDVMYDIYNATRSQEPIGVNSWNGAIMDAIDSLGLSSCRTAEAEEFANWNAIGGRYYDYY